MNVYLIRHADALPLGPAAASDEERPLSELGLQQAALIAAALRKLGIALDGVVTSPLRRSRQTADELVKHWGTPLPIQEHESLAPDGSSKRLAKLLRKHAGQHVALIGHEPDLSQHAAWLIGSKKAQIEFAKGGMACIVCEGPPAKAAGVLLWLVTPKWMA